MRYRPFVYTLGFVLLFGPAALVQSGGAAGFERHFRFSGDRLAVANLIGEIQVEGHDGPTFEIDLSVRGGDASPERIDFRTEDGDKARLTVAFPTKDERRFVYPPMGRNTKSTFTMGDDQQGGGWLSDLLPFLHGKRVTVSGSGSGLELWVDMKVKVPAGKKITIHNAVGLIDVEEIEADAIFDTHFGPVAVRNVAGALLVDTGSGSVDVDRIRGDVNIDTGSGSVTVRSCHGKTILVDTGSGSVDAVDVDCESLDIDTGSGRVTCHLDGASFRRKDRDEVALRIGDGDATVHLDAGSGSIHIHN